jgi:hypothetical protein
MQVETNPRRLEAYENSKRPVGRPRKEVEIVPEVPVVTTWGEKGPDRVLIELKLGYFPGDPSHPKNVRTGEPVKVPRGDQIWLLRDEAKRAVKLGIGVAVIE